ncbi:hypothetical protein DEU56DRAFT_721641, partial [Suillus clintonianus]|uniref:uncharacterized protein n=1 Tax=Suillus clintonianus TaxID=1904413 RepID=UPI001B877FD1
LSQADRDNIRLFKWQMTSHTTRRAYDQLRFALRDRLPLDSQFIILRRIAILSGVKPHYHDCCVNSCMAYTEKYVHNQFCEYCGEPRLDSRGKARRRFCYLPLIPRLQGFFQKPELIAKMSYRAEYRSDPRYMRDVFDSSHYQQLCRHKVVVDGEKLPYHYFSDPRDIALSLCTDSYLLY